MFYKNMVRHTPNKKYYTIAEKRAIIAEAYSRTRNIKQTARKYNIQPKQIRCWNTTFTTAEEQQLATSSNNCTLNKGRTRAHQDIFDAVDILFFDCRSRGLIVNYRLLTDHYIHQEISHGIYVQDNDSVTKYFNNVYHKIRRWCIAKGYVIRAVTHTAQNRVYGVEICNGYVNYVNNIIRMYDINEDYIVNLDETNLYFDMTSNRTLDIRGTRTINQTTTGSSNRATVLLAVTLSGKKLPPFIIFKGVTTSNAIINQFTNPTFNYPQNQYYAVQENAWVNEDKFLEFIEKVWSNFVGNNKNSMLIMDKFKAHMTNNVITKLQSYGTEVIC